MTWRFCLVTLTVAVAMWLSPKLVWANEGTFRLSGPNTSARCFAASVLVDERDYQLIMTCRNLIVPPGNRSLFYVVWAKREEVAPTGAQRAIRPLGRREFSRLGELERGKLVTSLDDPFTQLLVTAEQSDDPEALVSDRVVVQGTINPIDLGAEAEEEKLVGTPAPTAGLVTLAPTLRPTPTPSRRGVVGTALRVLLIVVIIIVALAIVISIIQRRSASRP